MSTDAIQKFLRPPDKGGAYTDEKLAALLAHAEDGKLSYHSCCCVAGVASAIHSLQGRGEVEATGHYPQHPMTLPYPECKLADSTSDEFRDLGKDDAERRAKLIPLIHAEMVLREKERETKFPEVWEEGYPQSVKEAVAEADFLALRIPENGVHE